MLFQLQKFYSVGGDGKMFMKDE